MVTYKGLFQFVIILVASVTLVIKITKRNRPAAKVCDYS